MHISGLVKKAFVAGIHPPHPVRVRPHSLCRLGLVPPVTLLQPIPARADVAPRPTRHDIVLAVHHLGGKVREHLAHGAEDVVAGVLDRGAKGHRARLGHAERGEHVREVHLLLQPAYQGRGDC